MKNTKAEATKQAIANASGGAYEWVGYGRGVTLTSGIRDVCEAAGAYWFVDLILSYQGDKRVKDDEMLQQMQFWSLKVDLEKSTAVATLERDSDDVVLTQAIEFTDFPLAEFKVYYQNKTVLLPNEY